MRCEELVGAKAGAKSAKPSQAPAGVIDDRDARAEVGGVPVYRLHWAQFTDVTDWAFACRHEDAAGAVQIVPLRLVPAVAVENLDPMILAVGDVNPTVGVAGDVVRDVELTGVGARAAPGQQHPPVGRVFVDTRVAVAIRNIDVALRRHGGMGAAVERLSAHVRSRFPSSAQGEQNLAVKGALADRVVGIVGQPEGFIRRNEHTVRRGKQTLTPGAQEIAVAVEHDHRVFAAVEDIDIVPGIDTDSADLLERPAGRQLGPVFDRFVGVVAVPQGHHVRSPPCSGASLAWAGGIDQRSAGSWRLGQCQAAAVDRQGMAGDAAGLRPQ